METLKKKWSDPDYKARRELVDRSLEVYPLGDFGAVEMGQHRFYGTRKGQPEKLDVMGRFVNVWERKNGAWTVCLALSYDHRDPGGRGSAPSPELVHEMDSMEGLLLSVLNVTEAVKSQAVFADDAELYDQESGLAKVPNKESVPLPAFDMRTMETRAAAPGSLVTFPLYDPSGANYGAIETGVYHLHKHEGDRKPKPYTAARFVHLWLRRNGAWKLSRSIEIEN